MAIGDAVTEFSAILTGQYMDIKPTGSTTEWVIHNIVVPFGSTCELYKTNGSNYIKAMNISSSGFSYQLHCTNSIYYTIRNTGASTIYASYDGIESHA